MHSWQPRRTLVLGDIHGAFKALEQVFERSGFDPLQDLLISLGDLTDYHPDSAEVITHLMRLPNHIAVRGNHDIWVEEWLGTRKPDAAWSYNGGDATWESIHYLDEGTLARFHLFFRNQRPFYLDDQNRLFVHAGILPDVPLEMQPDLYLYWERKLWHTAIYWDEGKAEFPKHPFSEIYIGHTPTTKYWPEAVPKRLGNITNMDTGIKKGGRLSIMDIDTKQAWQSDWQHELYPLTWA